jgi:dipeptidase E
MDDITKSGFKDYLIQYVENGGLLYGGSAGAIILGKRIDTQNDENKINLLQDDGLNLVNEYSIACHFKNDERAKFNEWAQNKKSPIICLPEGSGAILESGNIRCIGVNGCIIYMPEGNEIAINQADFFSVE